MTTATITRLTIDVPEFPVETLAGACAYCPVCLHAVYPDRSSQVTHYQRDHRGVVPTVEQMAAAVIEADRFAQEHAADLVRAAERRAARSAARSSRS
jgi:hypothetical protein